LLVCSGPLLLARLRLGLCSRRSGGSLCGARPLCLDSLGLDALGFRALGRCRLCCLLCDRICRGLLGRDLGGRRSNVSCLAASPDLGTVSALGGSCWRGLGGDGSRSASSPATCGRSRSRLPFGANALLPLPPGAHSGDLVVGQRAQMAAHGNVHLTK